MRDLSHNDVLTGVVFGFLRDVMRYRQEYDAHGMVFCFDSKTNFRKTLYPEYKGNRVEHDPVKQELKKELWRQIKLLRTAYLDYVGFSNVFCKRGYEADDLIASVVLELPQTERAIIFSGDHDLYQLFRSNVKMWNPKNSRLLSKKWFMREWNMHPSRWAEVKALAGCSSDNVPGIKGVGEKTAAKWVRGELESTSSMYDKILKNIGVLKTNLPLVQLPFKDTPIFELQEDQFKDKKWNKLTAELGMTSLRKKSTKVSHRRPIQQGFRYT